MRIWDALKETIERGVWVGFTEPDGYQRAIRYDATADVWCWRTKHASERDWGEPSHHKVAPIALNGYTINVEWWTVEVGQ